jgi:hypothetical protein
METNPYILENSDLFKHRPEFIELVKIFRYEIQNAQRPANELIIDDADLQKLLKVCRRTTSNYRSQKLIDHAIIGGKVFYLYSDVLKAFEKNKIPAIHNQLRFPI